jgi:hypothetical protein
VILVLAKPREVEESVRSNRMPIVPTRAGRKKSIRELRGELGRSALVQMEVRRRRGGI